MASIVGASTRLFDDFIVAGLVSNDEHLADAGNRLSTSALASTVKLTRKVLYHHQEASEDSCPFHAATVADFCFPEIDDLTSPSESFTFMLTQDDGKRVFGFCRRLVQPLQLPICLCVLSERPWFAFFMQMLDTLQLNYDLRRFVPAFITAACEASIPSSQHGMRSICIEPLIRGESFYGSFELYLPHDIASPHGIPFGTLVTSLGIGNLLRVMAALMTEQRIIFVVCSHS